MEQIKFNFKQAACKAACSCEKNIILWEKDSVNDMNNAI